MLTQDLLPVRRKNGELLLTPITGKVRDQHVELAEQVMALVVDGEGTTREQLLSDIVSIGQTPNEARIVKGYAKLIEDAVEFEVDRGRGASAIREAVFDRAATAWKSLRDGARFDRTAVLSSVAATFERQGSELEEELFIDLPGAQRVVKSVNWSAEELVERYDQGRILAVLLRAASLKATFQVRTPLDVRLLFRALKFRRLLFTLEREAGASYALTVSGPYSLFDSVTKYGLQLALCWPVIALQAELSLVADVRWGKKNEPLKFRYTTKEKKAGKGTLGGNRAETATSLTISDAGSGPISSDDADDETQFKQALARALPEVSVTVAERMLELPGTGLIVPDLCCTFDDGTEVFVEMLGFWSREAVFRRVELVEAGLVAPILFLVSSRLRVSEEVLDDASNAALYVYRGRINAATAASKINELYRRLRPPIPTKAKRRSK